MRWRGFLGAAVAAAFVAGCSSSTSSTGPEARVLVFFDTSGSSRAKETRVKITQGLVEVVPFMMDNPITGRSFEGRTYTFAQNIGGGEDMKFDPRTMGQAVREYQSDGLERNVRGEMFLMGSNLVPILDEISRDKTMKPDSRQAAIIVTDGGFTDDRKELAETLQKLKLEAEEPYIVFYGVEFNDDMIVSPRQDRRQQARKLIELRRIMEDAGYRNFAILPAEPKGEQKAGARELLERYFKEKS